MISKKWCMLPSAQGKSAVDLDLGEKEFQEQLLFNRGFGDIEEGQTFINADTSLAHDPMLLNDMERAVYRLKTALDSKEIIGIFGDFDADGITGTALLVLALRDLGAQVVPYLPDRNSEGHDLNIEALEILRKKEVSLLITVDCGATAADEIRIASNFNIDTIVTDHHTMDTVIPEACALINPRHPSSTYPFSGLTGVGMAYKLMEALHKHMKLKAPEHLMELVAIGTVADVGVLKGENRYMVKKGLYFINTTQNMGIRTLAEIAKLNLGSLNSEDLSFGLIPRINVASRLDHANTSLKLLVSNNRKEAKELASILEAKNLERRRLTDVAFKEAIRQVETEERVNGVPSIIFVASENWLPGVLGLIASKLSEYYYRPSIAVALGNKQSRGSARSIKEFDLIRGLQESGDVFDRFGGHPEAAGFTIPTGHLHLLQNRMRQIADRDLFGKELIPRLFLECEISPVKLTGPNLAFLMSLEPFGQGNAKPVFLARKAVIIDALKVGAERQHIKMKVQHGGQIWDAISFGTAYKFDSNCRVYDLAYSMGFNTWNGKTSVQLTVEDFRMA